MFCMGSRFVNYWIRKIQNVYDKIVRGISFDYIIKNKKKLTSPIAQGIASYTTTYVRIQTALNFQPPPYVVQVRGFWKFQFSKWVSFPLHHTHVVVFILWAHHGWTARVKFPVHKARRQQKHSTKEHLTPLRSYTF